MEVPKVMNHFLLARRSVASVASNAKAASASEASANGEWSSIGSAARIQGATTSMWAYQARWSAIRAAAALQRVNSVANTASGALAEAHGAAGDAKKAAEAAEVAEKRVRSIRDGLRIRAKKAVQEALPGTLRSLRQEAMANAQADAIEQARVAQADMETKGPEAAQAAMKPWQDAMVGAANAATAYFKGGDELAQQSTQMQAGAQAAQTQANQAMMLGDVVSSQKQMFQARQMMNQAISLNKQASSYYDTGEAIQKTLPAYNEQAVAAGYHAEVLVNPEAPPQGPPLVR
jgi:hypothetical protein